MNQDLSQTNYLSYNFWISVLITYDGGVCCCYSTCQLSKWRNILYSTNVFNCTAFTADLKNMWQCFWMYVAFLSGYGNAIVVKDKVCKWNHLMRVTKSLLLAFFCYSFWHKMLDISIHHPNLHISEGKNRCHTTWVKTSTSLVLYCTLYFSPYGS